MKIFRTFLCFLVLCAYAGCDLNRPSDSTLSYISSSQQTGVDSLGRGATQVRQDGGQPQQLPVKKLRIDASGGFKDFNVQVADSADTLMKGLMFRTSMPADEGMIFLFDQEQPLTFWMKNTLIPLDMVFIGKDWKVVSIQKDAQPCKADPCVLYPASANARYVLEINGGLSDKLGIQEGGKAQLY